METGGESGYDDVVINSFKRKRGNNNNDGEKKFCALAESQLLSELSAYCIKEPSLPHIDPIMVCVKSVKKQPL
jgi:hypothetical protein